jgi:hypothetical protein
LLYYLHMNKIVVFLIAIVIVLVCGFYILNNYKHPSDNSHAITPSQATQVSSGPNSKGIKTRQMTVAEDYFNAFSECMKKPPTEASGQVSIYCASHNEYAGKGLSVNLLKQYAPVVCGQNPPKSINANRTTEINESQALVILREDFGSSITDVTYQMQKENGVWKVENIICPR